MKRLKSFLSNIAVILSILGIVTFSLFILEEAVQVTIFGTWPAQVLSTILCKISLGQFLERR